MIKLVQLNGSLTEKLGRIGWQTEYFQKQMFIQGTKNKSPSDYLNNVYGSIKFLIGSGLTAVQVPKIDNAYMK